jgi:hypothetical protein
MVTLTGPNGRAGKGSGGCLMTLVVFGAVLYFGLPIAEVYVRQYSFSEEMRSQARLAPGLTDAVIRRRIADKADQLGLPPEAMKNLKIKRTAGRDKHITIDSEYTETVRRPGLEHTFTIRPHADAQL